MTYRLRFFTRSLSRILGRATINRLSSYRSIIDKVSFPHVLSKRKFGISQIQNRTIGDFDAEFIIPKFINSGDKQNSKKILIYLHGGAFILGSTGLYRALTCRFAQKCQCSVLVPNYRLAPENQFPAQLVDCLRTLAYVQKTMAPDKIFLAGDSAGGNLVLSTLLAVYNPRLLEEEMEIIQNFFPESRMVDFKKEISFLKEIRTQLPEKEKFKAAILLSPWLDLSHPNPMMKSRSLASHDLLLPSERHEEMVRLYLGTPISPSPTPGRLLTSPFISPGVLRKEMAENFPEILIHAGDADFLIRDMEVFVEQMEGLCRLRIWKGLPHVFQMFPKFLIPEAEKSLEEIGEFVKLK